MISQKGLQNDSKLKKILLEIGFFLGVIVAVVLTVVDVFFGLIRYAWGRIVQHKPNFNPWDKLGQVWIMIGRHLVYLVRLLGPEFRAQVKAQRQAMHRAAAAARDSFRGVRRPQFEDFDYVDAAVFFAYLPSIIGYGLIFIHIVCSTIAVISVYHVYHYYQPTAMLRTAPQPEVKVEYQPQVADKQEQDFGPWFDRGKVFDRVNSPDFLNIALIADTGSVKYSQTKVADPRNFTLTPFHERVVNPRPTGDGQVEFSDQLGKKYRVNKLQGFMFEGYASKVFMFDANGKLTTVAQGDVKTK